MEYNENSSDEQKIESLCRDVASWLHKEGYTEVLLRHSMAYLVADREEKWGFSFSSEERINFHIECCDRIQELMGFGMWEFFIGPIFPDQSNSRGLLLHLYAKDFQTAYMNAAGVKATHRDLWPSDVNVGVHFDTSNIDGKMKISMAD